MRSDSERIADLERILIAVRSALLADVPAPAAACRPRPGWSTTCRLGTDGCGLEHAPPPIPKCHRCAERS